MASHKFLPLISLVSVVSVFGTSSAYADQTSNANVVIRLGRPLVVRGPEQFAIDSPFAEVQTPSGYNGFTGNGGSYVINIAPQAPWAAGGTETPIAQAPGSNWFSETPNGVVTQGATSSFNTCGNWISGVLPQVNQTAGNVWGFVHTEGNTTGSTTYCPNPDTTSFSVATSTNYGQTWGPLVEVIKGMPSTTKDQGEGDCTVVDGNDGNYYLYCLRRSDWQTIVAFAPKSNPTGAWTKYYQGAWKSPALGGNADALDTLVTNNSPLGMGVGYLVGLNQTALVGVNNGVPPNQITKATSTAAAYTNELKMSLASDKIHFYPIAEPLIPFDPPTDSLISSTPGQWPTGTNAPAYGNWTVDGNGIRVAQNELYAYPSMMNMTDASNQLQNTFLLTHMYIEPSYVYPGVAGYPENNFTQRHLVFRNVTVSVSTSPVVPQVGIALSRWVNSSMSDNWTTTAPVPCNYSTGYSTTSNTFCNSGNVKGYYAYNTLFGYLMTQPHPTLPTTKLEDCVINQSNSPSAWPGHRDHLLTFDQTCAAAGYTRLRTAGWVYQSQQPNSTPIYRCWNPSLSQHFVSNQATCEGNGSMEFLLGYALAN